MARFGSVVLLAVLTLLPSTVLAQAAAGGVQDLDQLLDQVRQGARRESDEIRQREAEFLSRRDDQKRLLDSASATKTAAEQRSAQLERLFQANEAKIAELEATKQARLGTLGELFGTVRQVAGDLRSDLENSLVSAQVPDRMPFLDELGRSKALPSLEKLERLWFLLQQEMTESGKVVRFPTKIVLSAGGEHQTDVTRIGEFTLVANGKYLRWLPEVGKVAELGRQPVTRYLETVKPFEAATSGMLPLAVDPSRGQILSLLVQWPSRTERVEQGGPIGYFTVALGILGGIIGLWRLAALLFTRRKVEAQRRGSQVETNNPLGRVLAVHEQHRHADVETLELKLDEAILKEGNKLDRFLWIVKVVSVVAPLLGLLGTITGMIQAFQVMTLFGTGDPKLMAGGIAEALVTTMIGLMVAIPLVLLHSTLVSMKDGVVQVLDEQAVGLVALRAEGESSAASAA